MSESIKNLAIALSKFQEEVVNPPKSASNPFFKSKYTTLDVLVDTIKPILSKNGLSYIQSCGGDGSDISVTTLIMHSSGEYIETDALILKADKATAQGAGSAITYARRYALASAFGIASDEDDDGNGASHNQKPNQKPEYVKPAEQTKTQNSILSEKQINRMYAIATNAGYSHEDVKKLMLKKYNISTSKELTKKQYDEICSGYESLIKG